MESNHQGPSREQKIFNLGLPTETISLYLLCCGIKDAGMTLTTRNILERWNGSEADFQKAVEELEKRNVISRILSDGENNDAYQIKDVHDWR
ncbi:MAG: hypothetical protein R6U27_06675 [Desulfobacterales bacterium]